jgi:hypothetical protein
LSKPPEYSSGEFVARLKTKEFKFLFIIVALPLLFAILFRWKTILKWPIAEKISFAIFILWIIIYFLFKILDNRPRLIVSNSGITTKKQMIKWHEIEYFWMEKHKDYRQHFFYFHFKQKDSAKEYKIETSNFNKSYHEIYSAIITYSKGHNLVELVHSIG